MLNRSRNYSCMRNHFTRLSLRYAECNVRRPSYTDTYIELECYRQCRKNDGIRLNGAVNVFLQRCFLIVKNAFFVTFSILYVHSMSGKVVTTKKSYRTRDFMVRLRDSGLFISCFPGSTNTNMNFEKVRGIWGIQDPDLKIVELIVPFRCGSASRCPQIQLHSKQEFNSHTVQYVQYIEYITLLCRCWIRFNRPSVKKTVGFVV